MISTYAKIDGGMVVQKQMLDADVDALDPNFTWVDVGALSPQPDIGWAYDGQNFIPPKPPVVDNTGHKIILASQDPANKFRVTFTVDGSAPISIDLPESVVKSEDDILKYINSLAADYIKSQTGATDADAKAAQVAAALSAQTVDLTAKIGTDITALIKG